MMLELPKAHFDRVKPLFDVTQPLSTIIYCALDRTIVGRVFVDDLDQPSNSLLVTNFSGFSFTQATVDQQWLNETVAELRREFSFMLNLQQQSIPPGTAIGAVPGADKASVQPPPDFSESSASFEFRHYSPQGTFDLPVNRQLRRMDADLFARAMWHDRLLMAYGTVENFLANSIALCLMDGDEVCSEAYALFPGAGKYEMGIVTHEKYRQQGNAYLACKALLQLVEASGYLPNWSYRENNLASGATARKLGFHSPRKHLWFRYPQV